MGSTLLAAMLGAVVAVAGDGLELEVRSSPEFVDAGADAINFSVQARNKSQHVICLVRYEGRVVYVDGNARILTYVDDLDRDPELATCGGAYAFPPPRYQCLDPGETARFSRFAWTVPPQQTVQEIARKVRREQSAWTLTPGVWTLTVRLASLPGAEVPHDLAGQALCRYLANREDLVSGTTEIVVKADPTAAWTRRREALGHATGEDTEGQYILERYVPFFEDLTRIEVAEDRRATDTPAKVPRAVLERWDEWYSRHRSDIRWDENKRRYVLETRGKE